MGLLDGSGDDHLTVFAYDGFLDTTVIYDNAGNDTITVESGASVFITNDGSGGGSNTLVLEGLDSTDVVLSQTEDYLFIYDISGTEPRLIATLDNHFDPAAGPGVSVLDFGGSGADKSLTSLTSADLTAFGSQTLPNWYDDTRDWFGVELTGWWDPLVIDLDGDGVAADYIERQISGGGFTVTHPVYFDLDGDGFAQATEWHGDGFLARDINENGRIDDGTELFGTATVNGFEALAAFDANDDGVINSSDAIWADLIIWHDANEDGQTQSNELLTLASENITAINLAASSTSQSTGLTHTGTVTTTSGTLAAGSYNFNQDTSNARYAEDYAFDIRAAFLPTARGYNQLPDLHIAISLDNDAGDPDSLMALMQSIASYSFAEIFENYETVTESIEQLLFRWAGVEDLNPTSRGTFISDARIVEFLEEYFGQDFIDRNVVGGNPGAVQAEGIEELWTDDIFPRLKATILFQGPARRVFEPGQEYQLGADGVTGTKSLSQDGLDILEAAATALSSTAERQEFWKGLADFLFGMRVTNNRPGPGEFDLTTSEAAMLNAAIEGSDSALTWASSDHDPLGGITSIEYRFRNPVGETFNGNTSANNIIGSAFDDIVVGGAGADTLDGGAGGDVLYGYNADGAGDDGTADLLIGGAGNDSLYGGAGNDTLKGGTGSDHLFGGVGNDLLEDGETGGTATQNLLEGGSGDDEYYARGSAELTIIDESGTDLLSTHHKMTEASITLSRIGNNTIKLHAHNSIAGQSANFVLVDQILGLEPANDLGVESMRVWTREDNFGTAYTIDLKDFILNYTNQIVTYGSDTADEIFGIEIVNVEDLIYGLGGDDILYGDDGEDEILGGSGNDMIYGGIDNDDLNGDEGDDIVHGGDGNDVVGGDVGNDILYGEDGDDVLGGFDGDDTLYGGAGNDDLWGQDGNDIYIDDSGVNEIIETDGNNDQIIFTNAAITPELLSYQTYGSLYGTGVKIFVNDGSRSRIDIATQYLSDGSIEWIKFADGFELFLKNYAAWQFEANSAPGSDETINNGVDAVSAIIANQGTDRIYGNQNVDQISAGAGDDFLYGGEGNDFLHGGTGDDYFAGGTGNDRLWGGDGIDTASFVGALAGITASLLTGAATGEGDDNFLGIENLTGSTYADNLTGDNSNNILNGNAGNDVLHGNAGNDTLAGGSGTDTLDGSDGVDTADYSMAAAAVSANLTSGTASNDGDGGADTLTAIENLTGSAYNDVLTGDANANTLLGGDGNDTLYGNGGADVLNGGAGVDTIHGNAGNDMIDGGTGGDSLMGFEDNDTISGGDDGDTIYGDYNSLDESLYAYSGDDILHGGNGDDNLRGGKGTDTLNGDDGTDALYRGSGNDSLLGGAGTDYLYGDGGLTYTSYTGNDTLNGGAGMDTLYGQNGDDTLWAGEGADVLYGGTGTNAFAIYETPGQNNDMAFVQDWNTGTNNVIDISDLLSGYNSGVDDLSDFVNIAVSSHTTIQVDRDGAGSTFGWDNVLRLQNISSFETNVDTLVTNGTLLVA